MDRFWEGMETATLRLGWQLTDCALSSQSAPLGSHQPPYREHLYFLRPLLREPFLGTWWFISFSHQTIPHLPHCLAALSCFATIILVYVMLTWLHSLIHTRPRRTRNSISIVPKIIRILGLAGEAVVDPAPEAAAAAAADPVDLDLGELGAWMIFEGQNARVAAKFS